MTPVAGFKFQAKGSIYIYSTYAYRYIHRDIADIPTYRPTYLPTYVHTYGFELMRHVRIRVLGLFGKGWGLGSACRPEPAFSVVPHKSHARVYNKRLQENRLW